MAGNNNADPTWTFLLFLAILGLIFWLIWFFLRTEILEALRYLRMAELWVLGFISKDASACFVWLQEARVGDVIPTTGAVGATLNCFGRDYIASLSGQEAMAYYTITPESMGIVSRLTGYYLRWVLLALVLFIFYHVRYKTKRNSFRNTYNLESFIKVQAKVWPVISPIVNFNPAKFSSRLLGGIVPQKLPLFAEALSPEEWIAFHHLPMEKGMPVREAVYNALALQLGPRWAGFKGLPPYMQALVAAFALKGAQKREESDEFLGRIATCWSEKGGFRLTPELAAEVARILKDPKIGGKAQEIAARFAYRSTAIMGILKWSRFMGGVLASAQFLWLRGVDRHLWYALNNLGRRSFHSEGAGAMAHFMAEDLAQKALIVPRLETAILTINKYIAENQAKIPPSEGGDKALGFSQN